VVIVGDILHSRVALSNIFCLQNWVQKSCSVAGHLDAATHRKPRCKVEHDLDKALRLVRCGEHVAHPVGATGWGRHCQFPQPARVCHALSAWTWSGTDRMGKELVIMHPGPINRGVEVTSQVADHANSIILDQVENGVAIRMAVLYLLAARIPRTAV
jgi:aspartate carbamoyltransferase catalytic subunit